ncbi:MAG: 1,4-dihydroxy-6-naphthoate synthase [Desulfobacterales bacterium]|nr:1,4-dihydroxy-6-naphthoate synthase [Desulfobacterales bacterium]
MSSSQLLKMGFSPCPNDTFIFHALVHGRIRQNGFCLAVELHDVETLNRWAADEVFDVSKLSAYAWLKQQHRYRLLDSGAALGYGCGPLVVARPGFDARGLDGCRVAFPGRDTTAHLLFQLWSPHVCERVFVTYDSILEMLEKGQVDAGVIIHENRFTYAREGLRQVVDLGDWWERETGLPIPLGVVAVHTRVPPPLGDALESAVRESLNYARAFPQASLNYMQAHAQEMDKDVLRQHVAAYVNDFSLTLGPAGRKAIARLESMARERGLLA